MPIDISEVSVTFGHGIKREEYGPVKKAEVTIRAIVGQGEDGAVVLSVASRIAQDKVKELLLGSAAPAALETPLPPTSSASQASPSEGAEQPGEPQRRTRRTKAQIEADAAAAAGGQSTGVTATTAAGPSSEPQTPATNAASGGDATQTTAEQTGDDEWDVGATDAPVITDLELNHSCSETAGRTKKPLDVKALIGTFSPGGDTFDVEKGGRKFTVNDIPQSQRADFIAKLKALT